MSDGFLVDTSPPESAGRIHTGPELLRDGSFEGRSLPPHWLTSGNVTHIEGVAKTGNKAAVISGSIQQTVLNASCDTVQVILWTKGAVGTECLGSVSVSDMHHTFVVKNVNSWQKHVYFTHTDMGHDIIVNIRTLDGDHTFILDDVQMNCVTHQGEVTNESPISVHVVTLSTQGEGYVTASWNMVDTESPIAGFQWAVGTIRGQCLQLADLR